MSKFSAANWAIETVLVNHDNNFFLTQVAAALNNEGLLEFFFIDNSGNLSRGWQIRQDGGWGPSVSLAPISAKQITLARNDDGRLELFYAGTNSHLYHMWETQAAGPNVPLPPWSGQKEMSTDSARQISAVVNFEMQIFYVGTNNKLYYNSQTGPDGGEGNNHWVGEKLLSDTKIQEVVAVTTANGNPMLFYRGLDNGLYYRILSSNGWQVETRFSPYLALQLVATLNSQKLIEIFYVGTNNLLYFNRQTSANDTGAWLGESQLLGVQAKQVAVAMDSNGVLEVFFTGLDDSLWHTWETATDEWAPAQAFGASKALQMTAVPNHDGHLELIFIGTNGVLYHNWQVPVVR